MSRSTAQENLYLQRINAVIGYIRENLNEDLSLEALAQVAMIRCLGGIEQEYKALQYLFRYWLPRNRYQPANLPGMELYRRQPDELGWETFDIDCAIPILEL